MARLTVKRDVIRVLFRLCLAIILCGAFVIVLRVEATRLSAVVPILLIASGAYVAGKLLEVTWRKLGELSLALFPKPVTVVKEAGQE